MVGYTVAVQPSWEITVRWCIPRPSCSGKTTWHTSQRPPAYSDYSTRPQFQATLSTKSKWIDVKYNGKQCPISGICPNCFGLASAFHGSDWELPHLALVMHHCRQKVEAPRHSCRKKSNNNNIALRQTAEYSIILYSVYSILHRPITAIAITKKTSEMGFPASW